MYCSITLMYIVCSCFVLCLFHYQLLFCFVSHLHFLCYVILSKGDVSMQ